MWLAHKQPRFIFFCMQFYKNLSTGLKDIVWKTGEEVKEAGSNGKLVR